MKKTEKSKGITLVALIVTIIVLLILSGIVLSLVIGQGGIMNLAEQAGKNYVAAEEQEKKDLEDLYSSMIVATNDDSKITISMEDLSTLIDNKVKENLNNTAISGVPAGTVISYITGNVAPEGYLKCDGTVYNISEYQALADSIKNGLGSYNYYGGDGETTFAVPDLRGEFLRGTGTATRNTGAGAAVGVHQDATRHIDYWNSASGYFHWPNANSHVANADKKYTSSSGRLSGQGSTDTSTQGTYTSRPTNTSVLYCIKY